MTSLAQQLKRLQAPQTNILKDSKKRASLLFDPKEAANKDRETIYEIGLSGLEELISLNSCFAQFETNLFVKDSRDLQRAVESMEINKKLNKTIKQFLLQLSPYFLLQSSHKCLEWLIRRFQIHDYNKDEFMMLILPYHETRIFIRCIQLFDVENEQDKWHWLKPLQKPGIPLPKQTIFNHAANDPWFLQFIGTCVKEAIKVLDVRAHTLQTVFGFYCTTIIGTIFTIQTVKEVHIMSILPTLLKGLSSNIIDFVAASYMIVGQLVSKLKFNKKLLDTFLIKISNCQHTILQMDSIMLLVLIFTNQVDEITEIPEEAFLKILENTWFSSMLRQVTQQGVNITSFYVKLTGQCLRKVQLKDDNWVSCKNLLENLLLDIEFTEQDAELIIRSALDNYTLREKPPLSNNALVIMLDSDDEAEDGQSLYIDDNNLGISKWYSEYLRKLERQYPDAFDKVLKLVMKGDNGIISKGKRTALKAVLGFLLKAAYNDDETNVFENLYHHSAQQRILAIKYLSNNFGKMDITSESQDLFRDSIMERLNDQNPEVVKEILKMNTQKLLNLIGKTEFVQRLIKILTRGLISGELWRVVISEAVKLLISPQLLEKENAIQIFIGIFPFLFPTNDAELIIYQEIMSSSLSKYVDFVKELKKKSQKAKDAEDVIKINHELLKNEGNTLPDIKIVMNIIEAQYKVEINPLSAFYSTILLSYSLPKQSAPALSRSVLELAFKSLNLKCKFDESSITKAHASIRQIIFSNEIFILVILEILSSTKLDTIGTFEEKPDILLILKIYEVLLIKGCSIEKSAAEREIFLTGLSKFLHILFKNMTETLHFCLNYFGGHTMVSTFGITPEVQMWTVKLATQILKNAENENFDQLTNNGMVHILFGLNSPQLEIRKGIMEFIEVLIEKWNVTQNSKFWNEIINYREEVICDHEQISLILYKILTQKAKVYQDISNQFVEMCSSSPKYIVANLMEILKYVNTAKNLPTFCEIGNEIYKKMQSSEDLLLSTYDSDILRHIINRYNSETIKAISTSKPALNFLLNTLNNHKLVLSGESEVSSPARLLLEVIDDELYEQLSNEYKTILINSIVETATYCEFNDITGAAHKLMKKLDIDCKIIEGILLDMKNVKNKKVNEKRSKFTLSVEILSNEKWKRGVTLLEFLQNKKKLTNVELMIPHFFDILKKCLNFEEQSPVEYTKQLLLSCILHCCQKISPDGTSKRDVIPDNMFHINLVVQCIRATQNPQTHHHALLLLCHTASMIPEQVLHNLVDIFTFMGSSVVRHDDVYSFQIISKIIEKIIPILTKSNETNMSERERENLTIPVLKIFADIILDVPEHRRIPLYTKLINMLDPKKYLWKLVAVVFECQVTRPAKDGKKPNENDDKLPRRLEIALSIANEFEVDVIIETCTQFLEYLKGLPVDRPEDVESMDIDITDTSIFLVEGHTAKQLRHYKYIICQFIGILTSSPQFVNRIAALTDADVKHMKPFYQNFIIKILLYIADVSKATEKFSDSTHHRYWKVILHHCYDILDNAISLLSVDIFLLVVIGLLRHKITSVRKRVIELLISKIQHKSDFIEKCDASHLIQVIEPLCSIFEEIRESDGLEIHVLQQTALIAIKLLSKVLCTDHPNEFKDILDKVIEISQKREKLPTFLQATVILCLSEICVNLRAHSLSNLPKFMPILIDSLKKQIGADNNDPLLIASIVGILKIIESIPLFLSPYIVKIITILSNIASVTEDEKIQNRLVEIFSKIGSTIPGRVLIPSIDKSYQILIKTEKYKSIPGVMKIISNSFDQMTADELGTLQSDLSNFFINALHFRSACSDLYVVNLIEAEVIKAFVCLILKLSESTFRPLYYKMYDWAIREGGGEYRDRAITFYNLSSHVADALKSLFTLFADSFFQNAADLLNNAKYFDGLEHAEEKSILLVEYIMKTLNLVFLHDSRNFTNAARFNIIMQPIVDQIENPFALKEEKLQNAISNCISQLAIATNDDSLWKQLNYQVFLKTRTNDPKVRLFALKTSVEIARKLGENFLPFLPETIPFLAELLEDENYNVEKSAQAAVQELEKIVGEPLQKYF